MSSIDDELEAMRARHRAIARYRLLLCDPLKKRGEKKKEVERGLTYDEAKTKQEKMNAELKAQGYVRFMDPSYEIELTNTWDTLSEYAKASKLAEGKTEADFRC